MSVWLLSAAGGDGDSSDQFEVNNTFVVGSSVLDTDVVGVVRPVVGSARPLGLA